MECVDPPREPRLIGERVFVDAPFHVTVLFDGRLSCMRFPARSTLQSVAAIIAADERFREAADIRVKVELVCHVEARGNVCLVSRVYAKKLLQMLGVLRQTPPPRRRRRFSSRKKRPSALNDFIFQELPPLQVTSCARTASNTTSPPEEPAPEKTFIDFFPRSREIPAIATKHQEESLEVVKQLNHNSAALDVILRRSTKLAGQMHTKLAHSKNGWRGAAGNEPRGPVATVCGTSVGSRPHFDTCVEDSNKTLVDRRQQGGGGTLLCPRQSVVVLVAPAFEKQQQQQQQQKTGTTPSKPDGATLPPYPAAENVTLVTIPRPPKVASAPLPSPQTTHRSEWSISMSTYH